MLQCCLATGRIYPYPYNSTHDGKTFLCKPSQQISPPGCIHVLIDWFVFSPLNQKRAAHWGNFLVRQGHEVRFLDASRTNMFMATSSADLVIVDHLLLAQNGSPSGKLAASVFVFIDRIQAMGIPVIADFAGDDFDSPIYAPGLEKLARRADLSIAISTALAGRIRELSDKPIRVIGKPVLSAAMPAKVFKQKNAASRLLSFGLLARYGPALQLAWRGSPSGWRAMNAWMEAIAPLRLEQRFELSLVTTPDADIHAAVADFNCRFGPRASVKLVSPDGKADVDSLKRAEIVLVPSLESPDQQVSGLDDPLVTALNAGCHVIASPQAGASFLAAYVDWTDDPLGALKNYLARPALVGSRITAGQEAFEAEFGAEKLGHKWLEALDAASERSKSAPMRILFFAAEPQNMTLELRFLIPLRPLREQGAVAWKLIAENHLSRLGAWESSAAEDVVHDMFMNFQPTMVVFCRYAGPFAQLALELCAEADIPTLMHLDDDLLNIPKVFGAKKAEFHHNPVRLAALRTLIAGVDLVLTANQQLIRRLQAHGFAREYAALQVPAAGPLLREPAAQALVRIGYMGGADHASDLPLVIPALVDVMNEFAQVHFELIGNFTMPAELEVFGDRVRRLPAVAGCESFMTFLAQRNWDIGLCMLANHPFNLLKTHIKWVDYTRVGAAVIASRGTVFDECGANGRALLVDGFDEWREAMRTLVLEPDQRVSMVRNSQDHVKEHYTMRLQQQEILQVLGQAARLRGGTLSSPVDSASS